MEGVEKKKKGLKSPNVYTLLLIIILICAILTWIVPAGQYDMITNDSGREVVDPTTFHYVDRTPVGVMGFLASIFNGMINGAEIIFLVFVTGAALGVIFAAGAFDAAIVRIALAMNGKEKALIPVMMLVFCFMGATMGSAEDLIVYIPILVAMCLAVGFDSITAVAVVLVGAGAGFAGSFMNPYTEGVAQSIAELPLFSGMWFRFCILVCFFVSALIFVWRYASKIHKNPELSGMYEFDQAREDKLEIDKDKYPFGFARAMICIGFLVTIGLLIYGLMVIGWWYAELCGLFVGLAIWAGLWGRMGLNEWGEAFGAGMQSMAIGALVIGFARAILIVLESGLIIHTVLHACAVVLGKFPAMVSAVGMYIFQCLCNYFIPSGSGQAAVTMPLMAPLADLVGVTRQTACIAFQMGDGISNIFTPTSGYLMASLAIAKVPWDKWAKWILPLIGIWYAIGAVFVVIAQAIQLGPF